MKINLNRLLFRRKPLLVLLFFITILVSASMTKEDRLKVREFKRDLMIRLKLYKRIISDGMAIESTSKKISEDSKTKASDKKSNNLLINSESNLITENPKNSIEYFSNES